MKAVIKNVVKKVLGILMLSFSLVYTPSFAFDPGLGMVLAGSLGATIFGTGGHFYEHWDWYRDTFFSEEKQPQTLDESIDSGSNDQLAQKDSNKALAEPELIKPAAEESVALIKVDAGDGVSDDIVDRASRQKQSGQHFKEYLSNILSRKKSLEGATLEGTKKVEPVRNDIDIAGIESSNEKALMVLSAVDQERSPALESDELVAEAIVRQKARENVKQPSVTALEKVVDIYPKAICSLQDNTCKAPEYNGETGLATLPAIDQSQTIVLQSDLLVAEAIVEKEVEDKAEKRWQDKQSFVQQVKSIFTYKRTLDGTTLIDQMPEISLSKIEDVQAKGTCSLQEKTCAAPDYKGETGLAVLTASDQSQTPVSEKDQISAEDVVRTYASSKAKETAVTDLIKIEDVQAKGTCSLQEKTCAAPDYKGETGLAVLTASDQSQTPVSEKDQISAEDVVRTYASSKAKETAVTDLIKIEDVQAKGTCSLQEKTCAAPDYKGETGLAVLTASDQSQTPVSEKDQISAEDVVRTYASSKAKETAVTGLIKIEDVQAKGTCSLQEKTCAAPDYKGETGLAVLTASDQSQTPVSEKDQISAEDVVRTYASSKAKETAVTGLIKVEDVQAKGTCSLQEKTCAAPDYKGETGLAVLADSDQSPTRIQPPGLAMAESIVKKEAEDKAERKWKDKQRFILEMNTIQAHKRALEGTTPIEKTAETRLTSVANVSSKSTCGMQTNTCAAPGYNKETGLIVVSASDHKQSPAAQPDLALAESIIRVAEEEKARHKWELKQGFANELKAIQQRKKNLEGTTKIKQPVNDEVPGVVSEPDFSDVQKVHELTAEARANLYGYQALSQSSGVMLMESMGGLRDTLSLYRTGQGFGLGSASLDDVKLDQLHPDKRQQNMSGVNRDVGSRHSFVQVFGMNGKRQSINGLPGNSLSGQGINAGTFYQQNSELVTGFMLSITKNSLTYNDGLGSGVVESVRAGPFMSWNRDDLHWDAALMLGNNNYNQKRHNASGNRLKSKASGTELSAYVGMGYDLHLGSGRQGLTLTPMTELLYVNAGHGGYSEQGIDGQGMEVKSISGNQLISRIGFETRYLLPDPEHPTEIKARLGMQHQHLTGHNAGYRQREFDGVVMVPAFAENSTFIGLGIQRKIADDSHISLNYNGTRSSNGLSHGLQLTYESRF